MMVEDFGSYLKHERELRGVPLEEISGATKIHIRYLKALEENAFDELPGEVFIKGYIRSYANTIGSDVEEMLNIYKESVELKKQENIDQEKSSNTQPKNILAYGLLILALIGLLFGGGILIKNREKNPSIKSEIDKLPVPEIQAEIDEPISSNISEKQQQEETKDALEARLASPETLELSSSIDSTVEAVKKENVNEETILSPQKLIERTAQSSNVSQPDLDSQSLGEVEKPLKLLIQAKELSWFNMTIDEFREEDFILPAGTTKTYWGNEKIRLTVGNKTGVEIFLNGKAIALPASEDKVVKDFIINSKLVE
jgi:cytoskeleton protein RodZ